MEELRRAVSAAGSMAKLAERINVELPDGEKIGPSAIGNWFARGKVPPEHVLNVCRATEWNVIPHRIAPEIYPNEDDGLPPAVRQRLAAEAVNAQLARTRAAIEQGGQQPS
jgi:DNA-binding transcriptional regulator YdaS (Cro superfamily)